MGKRKGKQLQIDQAQILELPIYVPEKNKVDEIIELIQIILDNMLLDEQSVEAESVIEKIDNIIYDLYGLTSEEKKRINTFVETQRNL